MPPYRTKTYLLLVVLGLAAVLAFLRGGIWLAERLAG